MVNGADPPRTQNNANRRLGTKSYDSQFTTPRITTN